MEQYDFETIAAISTPMGQGGLGVVRLSGPDSVAIIEQIFISKNNTILSQAKNFTLHYGWIKSGDRDDRDPDPDLLDEVLVSLMRAPHSYTKEDVVEISCHGSLASLKAILALLCLRGARLAQPGEFTKRAFLNGRIDLAQAEAVLDIIQAKSESFLKVSTHQLKGDLSKELDRIRESLMAVYTQLEAHINFPEEDIDVKQREELKLNIEKARDCTNDLLACSDHGRILRDGIKIVICGKPNVGKSSLLNVLLKTPRAIVSDIAGTTRDTIEEGASIQGIPLQLVDTAGILEPRDLIEEEAVKRSHMHMGSADLLLLICDVSVPLSQEDEDLIARLEGMNVLVVLNKSDLPSKIDCIFIEKRFSKDRMIETSTLTKDGCQSLEKKILDLVWHAESVETSGILISNLRHIESLKDALALIEESKEMFSGSFSLEFISEKIKQATACLDRITGRDVGVDLIDQIFSQFCVGK